MFFPEGQVRVHLYGRPVDMRRSFDGLYAITRQALVTLPRFHVHQIVVNLLMNGERDGEERSGTESSVHR